MCLFFSLLTLPYTMHSFSMCLRLIIFSFYRYLCRFYITFLYFIELRFRLYRSEPITWLFFLSNTFAAWNGLFLGTVASFSSNHSSSFGRLLSQMGTSWIPCTLHIEAFSTQRKLCYFKKEKKWKYRKPPCVHRCSFNAHTIDSCIVFADCKSSINKLALCKLWNSF